MKKVASFLIILLILLSMSGCNNSESPDSVQSHTDITNNVDNSPMSIDRSSISKIEKTGFIPVSTDSIKDVLNNTGRFEIEEMPQFIGVDVHCDLDKTDTDRIAGIFFTVLEEDDDKVTQIVSYNFSKTAVQGQDESTVRWGLNLLLNIFGDTLTDDVWNDILAVSEMNNEVDPLGTDYDGYSNEDTGIKLIYADLGNNIQIDIKPYSQYT